MTDTTQTEAVEPETTETDAPAGFNFEAGIAGAAAAETAEILNLLGDQESGGSCCGGSCCAA